MCACNEGKQNTFTSGIEVTSSKMYETLLRIWPQWITTMIVTLLSISIGLAIGWTSPYLALLTSEEAPFLITEDEASWIASLLPLGRVFGAIIGSLCVEYIDSKNAALLTGVPLIVGWSCIICANSAVLLYVFRTLSGVSMGMLFSCCPLFIAEISTASIRGALVAIMINGLSLGTLFGNIMGPYMSIMLFGIISLALTICYMGIFLFLPRSPHYFIQRGDMERASRSIQWYSPRCDARSELEKVEHYLKLSSTMTVTERFKRIKEPHIRQSFTIIIILFTFMQFSGLNSVVYYMEIIVRKAMVTSIAPSNLVIVFSTAGIIFGWIGAYSIDRCGRRILIATSSICVMISMLLFALHFWLLDYDYDPSDFEWLVILSLLIFALLYLGLVPVPSTMLGELFPSDLNSIAGFIGSTTSAACAFVSTRTFQPLMDILRIQYIFCIYAIILGACVIYSVTKVPETKGKTLQEIQDMMATGNNKRTTQEKNRDETENNPTN